MTSRYKVVVESTDKFSNGPDVTFESKHTFRIERTADDVAERFQSFLGLSARVVEVDA